jgi:hypothetical protein
VINTDVEVFFADNVVLCAPTRSQLRNLLKLTSKWVRNNEILFGINKYASLIVRGEVSKFLNNSSNSTFYLSSQEIVGNSSFLNSIFNSYPFLNYYRTVLEGTDMKIPWYPQFILIQ